MKKMKVLINDVVDLIDQKVDIKGIVVHGKEFIRVVRCKDCRWAEQSQYGLFCSMGIYDDLSVDDYCSRGERREDAEI